jgi:Arc/MetJ-type ribon-helix-helix transcriptional regulator
MTIHIPENLESSILAAVRNGRYTSIDDAMAEAAWLLVERLKQERAPESSATHAGPAPTRKPLWERAAELRKSIPKEEWAKLPADGAEQLDHYLYGSPRRPAE